MPSLNDIKNQISKLGQLDTFGTKKEINSLPEILRENENITALTSGLHQGNTWLIVCTTMRILFLDKGFIYGLKQIDIPLDKINSVQHETGLFMADIVIWDGASKVVVENILKEPAKEFVKRVHDTLHEYKEKGRNPVIVQESKDLAGQLLKLAELKEKGILTEDEFLDQKKKLLA